MANIGSLVVTLGVDTAAFQSDLGRANAILQRQIAEISKQGEIVGKAVGTALAAAAAGATALVKQSINNADELSKLSAKVGLSTEALSSMKYAAGLAGVELAGLQTGLVKFSRTITEAAAGSRAQDAAFRAMGISVRDVQGNLIPTDRLLGQVADKFAGYNDGASKAALAVELFGRAGADLIPLLNGGADGLREAADEAKAYGIIVSDSAAKASEQFNDNLDRLHTSLKGFGNQLAQRAVPYLASFTDQLAEGAKKGDEYGRAADAIVGGMQAIVKAAVIARGAVEGLTNFVAASIDTLIAFGEIASGALTNIGHATAGSLLAIGGQYLQAKEQFDLAGKSLGDGWEAGSKRVRSAWASAYAGIDQAIKDADRLASAIDKPSKATGIFANVIAGVGPAVEKVDAPIVKLGNSAGASAKKVKDFSDEQQRFRDQVLGLSAELDGPLGQAQERYRSQLTAAARAMLEGKASRDDYLRYQQLLERQLVDSTREIERQLGVVESYVAQMRGETATLGMTERQKALADALKKSADEWQRLSEQERAMAQRLGKVDPTSDAGIKAITDATNAFYDQKEAIEASQRAAEQWASLWQDSARSVSDAIAGFATGSIRKFSDFGKALIDIAKQTVARIISSFLEMRVIGPLFQSILGGIGGGSGYGGLVQAGMGLVTGGGSGGALDFTSSATGQTANSLFSPSGWINAGKSLWNGFMGGASSSGGIGLLGTWTGQQPIFGAGVDPFNMGGGAYGSYVPSAFGYAAGAAGGLLAGYNRYQNRYNTATGLLGGAAYGIGTAGLIGGLGSLAVGGSFGAGLAGGLGAGAAAGAGATGLAAAIPIVGWAALAAMLIDKFTGGSLFGTDANKFQRGESNLTVGPDGGVISIGADYKGRKPLFGGSYHEWKNIAPTQEQIDAANGFYKAILDQSTSFAKQFGQNVGEVATGTFRQIFDKKGNVTGSLSIVNGVEYQGEDQQAFAQRILAESMILDLKKIGVDISDYTQQFIKDAEAYAQAVQDSGLAIQYANQDLKNGIDISGGKGLQGAFDTTLQYQDGSDSIVQTYQRLSQEAQDLHDGIKLLTGQDTIESIEAFIRESQKVGETLAQTYVRLQQATAAYNSFVGQFAPQAEYVDDFEAALSGVCAQMKANIDQANALAKAAGLEGAAIEDLINIHASAADQFATLLLQLKDSARSLAYQMGLIGPYNLDQVNSEIADLEGRANAGASAVQDFGRTITDVANRANNALQLLLGDLSPLNDQEKLQKALEGLRAGSVSQEEVLQIGRRLYASSEAYNQLFRQVQQFTPRPSAVGGGSYSSGANAAAANGLTEKERQRLEELYKQQAGLQAAQDYANAQTLARQIAEITASGGETLDELLKEWGLSADELAQRLRLEGADQLQSYIDAQKKLVDSNGQNTTVLADLLRQIRDLLSHGGTDFRSPGGRNQQVGEMALDDPSNESGLGRLNHNLDRLIVPPSRNRRAPGVPYR